MYWNGCCHGGSHASIARGTVSSGTQIRPHTAVYHSAVWWLPRPLSCADPFADSDSSRITTNPQQFPNTVSHNSTHTPNPYYLNSFISSKEPWQVFVLADVARSEMDGTMIWHAHRPQYQTDAWIPCHILPIDLWGMSALNSSSGNCNVASRSTTYWRSMKCWRTVWRAIWKTWYSSEVFMLPTALAS